jgi:hypothetical protein
MYIHDAEISSLSDAGRLQRARYRGTGITAPVVRACTLLCLRLRHVVASAPQTTFVAVAVSSCVCVRCPVSPAHARAHTRTHTHARTHARTRAHAHSIRRALRDACAAGGVAGGGRPRACTSLSPALRAPPCVYPVRLPSLHVHTHTASFNTNWVKGRIFCVGDR